MKQLRSQGVSDRQLITVFDAFIWSRLRCTQPAWGGFLSKELEGLIDAFLRRMLSFVHCSQLHSVRQLIAKGGETVSNIIITYALLVSVLPPSMHTRKPLRSRGHNFVLPSCHFELYKRSFINRCLLKYVLLHKCLLLSPFVVILSVHCRWRVCRWLIHIYSLTYLLTFNRLTTVFL